MNGKSVNNCTLDFDETEFSPLVPHIKWDLPIQNSVTDSAGEMMSDSDIFSQISSDATYFSPYEEDNEFNNRNIIPSSVESPRGTHINENHGFHNKTEQQTNIESVNESQHKINYATGGELYNQDQSLHKNQVSNESQYDDIVPGTYQQPENEDVLVLISNTVNSWQEGEEHNVADTFQGISDADSSKWDDMIDVALQENDRAEFEHNINFLLSETTDTFLGEERDSIQNPPIKLKLSHKNSERKWKTIVFETQTQVQLETDVDRISSSLAQCLIITDSPCPGEAWKSSADKTSSCSSGKKTIRKKTNKKTHYTQGKRKGRSISLKYQTPSKSINRVSNSVRRQGNGKYKVGTKNTQLTNRQKIAATIGMCLRPKKKSDESQSCIAITKGYSQKNPKPIMRNRLMDIREEVYRCVHGLDSSLNKTHARRLLDEVEALCTNLEAIYSTESHSNSKQRDLESVRQVGETLQKQLQGIIDADEEIQELQGFTESQENSSCESLVQLTMDLEEQECEDDCIKAFTSKSIDSSNSGTATNAVLEDDFSDDNSEVTESETELIDLISPIVSEDVSSEGTTETGHQSPKMTTTTKPYGQCFTQSGSNEHMSTLRDDKIKSVCLKPKAHFQVTMNYQPEICTPSILSFVTAKENSNQLLHANERLKEMTQISAKTNFRPSKRDPRLNRKFLNSPVTIQNTVGSTDISKDQSDCTGFSLINLMSRIVSQDDLAQSSNLSNKGITLNRTSSTQKQTEMMTMQTTDSLSNSDTAPVMDVDYTVNDHITNTNQIEIPLQSLKVSSEVHKQTDCKDSTSKNEMRNLSKTQISEHLIRRSQSLFSKKDFKQTCTDQKSQSKQTNTEISQIQWQVLNSESASQSTSQAPSSYNTIYENYKSKGAIPKHVILKCTSNSKNLKITQQKDMNINEAPQQQNNDTQSNMPSEQLTQKSIFPRSETSKQNYYPFSQNTEHSCLQADTVAKDQLVVKTKSTSQTSISDSSDWYLNVGLSQSQQTPVLGTNGILNIKSMWLPSLSEFTPNSSVHEVFWKDPNAPWPEDWRNDYEDW